MMNEAKQEQLKKRIQAEKDPKERAAMRKDLDQAPLTDSQLSRVMEREEKRKENDIRQFHEARNH
jgi:hypothetical protein